MNKAKSLISSIKEARSNVVIKTKEGNPALNQIYIQILGETIGLHISTFVKDGEEFF